VLAEAFRVLKPGGRFAVSDIVVRGELPAPIRRSLEAWAGCVAGALTEEEYREKLARAGFSQIDVEPTRIYRLEDAKELLAQYKDLLETGTLEGASLESLVAGTDGKLMSAFVRAVKPG
jgi:SAM-dependent methyltransferase